MRKGIQVYVEDECVGILQGSDETSVEVAIFSRDVQKGFDYYPRPVYVNTEKRFLRIRESELKFVGEFWYRNAHNIPEMAEKNLFVEQREIEFSWRVLPLSISDYEQVFDSDKFYPL